MTQLNVNVTYLCYRRLSYQEEMEMKTNNQNHGEVVAYENIKLADEIQINE